MLFYAPNISDTAKMIYAAVTYVAWGMIYTASDVPFWALPNALTPNADERGGIISKARTANGVGSAVPTAFFMVLGFILPKFNLSGTELEKTKYMCIALFCAIVGNLLFIRVYFKTKERVNIPIPPKKDKNQPSALKLIFTCKPLMLTALMGILSAARYMYQAGAVHAARYSFLYRQGPDRSVRRGAGGGTARQYLAGEHRVQRGQRRGYVRRHAADAGSV